MRGTDLILLNNMSVVQIARPKGVRTEAPIGLTRENAAAIAATGVDYLAVGALTHSAAVCDHGVAIRSSPAIKPTTSLKIPNLAGIMLLVLGANMPQGTSVDHRGVRKGSIVCPHPHFSSANDPSAQLFHFIGSALTVPFVRADRTTFLTQEFANHPQLSDILTHGPQTVLSAAQLREHAHTIVARNAKGTSALALATGLAAHPLLMVPAGSADLAQYFAYTIRMAQHIAYLYGDSDLHLPDTPVDDFSTLRLTAYLGAMYNIPGSLELMATASPRIGMFVGQHVALHAVRTSAWYPLMKQVATQLCTLLAKHAATTTATKSFPLIGGLASCAVTWMSFKPLGLRLIDTFETLLNSTHTSTYFTTPTPAIEGGEWNIIDAEIIEDP